VPSGGPVLIKPGGGVQHQLPADLWLEGKNRAGKMQALSQFLDILVSFSGSAVRSSYKSFVISRIPHCIHLRMVVTWSPNCTNPERHNLAR
jgi:hypothetical protein